MSAMAGLTTAHFLWRMDGTVAVIQLNRPDRKNPLTFESYAELRDTFRALPYPAMSTQWCFCPMAETSVLAAMCTTSLDRSSPWRPRNSWASRG